MTSWIGYALLLAAISGGCKEKSAGSAAKEVQAMNAMEAFGMIQNDFGVLVDVREESEVKEGMAAPALWFPTSQMKDDSAEWKAFLEKLPKNKKIIFYCAAGGRAGKVATKLSTMGYQTANAGGFSDWVAAKLPVKKP